MSGKSKVLQEDYHQYIIEQGWSKSDLADKLGVDEASVRSAGKKYHKDYSHLLDTDIARAFRSELDKPLELAEGDGWAITADYHFPLTDLELMNFFITTMRNLGIRKLLVGGDVFNGDALSQYFPKQANAGLEVELVVVNYAINKLLESFDEIVFLKGNHDYRYVRARDYTISFIEAINKALTPLGDQRAKITVSNLDHCFINAESGRYYVCHPKSYSQIPGTVALKLGAKYPGCHIVTAHSHHTALMYQKDGVHLAVEIGGFYDRDQTQYLQDSTTFPIWTNGFGLVTPSTDFVLFRGNNRRDSVSQLYGTSTGLVLPS